jgi:hypothetical protein
MALTPVAVRTKVRAAPSVAHSVEDSGSSSSSSSGAFPGATTGSGGAATASEPGGSSCFLEVSIENAMKDDSLLLQSVRFVPLPGVSAEDPVAHYLKAAGAAAEDGGGIGAGHSSASAAAAAAAACRTDAATNGGIRDSGELHVTRSGHLQWQHDGQQQHPHPHQQQHQQQDGSPASSKQSPASKQQLPGAEGSPANGIHTPFDGTASDTAAGGLDQSPPGAAAGHSAQQQRGASVDPALPSVIAALTPLLPTGNRHYLWLVRRGEGAAVAAAAAAAASAQAGQPAPPQGGLGRLEICWRSADGRCGRLQTQPIVGGAAAFPLGGASGGAGGVALGVARLPAAARVDTAFTLVLRLQRAAAASAAAGEDVQPAATAVAGSRALGPLLLLHSDASQQRQSGLTRNSESSSSQQQTTTAAAAAAVAFSTLGSFGGGGSGGSSAAPHSLGPGVVVVGPRVVSLGEVSPGDTVEVPVTLLPLRRGWQRLPAFVVVGRDGAPCASVHDVSLLVS